MDLVSACSAGTNNRLFSFFDALALPLLLSNYHQRLKLVLAEREVPLDAWLRFI
jgi:hypothetical protein